MAISSIGMKNQYAGFVKNQQPRDNHAVKDQSSGTSARKLESQERTQNQQNRSVVDQSLSYASQLRASRKKTEKSSLEKKKLQYNFKKISSQIVRSKTSVSARKAVQSAKREIMRLKRLKANGEYDEEELELAIEHAKSMEKIAKKKVSHLEQEEMVERSGKGLSGELEEVREEQEDSEGEEFSEEDAAELSEEEMADAAAQEDMDAALEEQQYQMQLQMAEMAEAFAENLEQVSESMSDSMDDLMSELSEGMKEMMEDMDLGELFESTFAPDPNMSEDDLKMLKIKHRAKEMKEIAEADKIYLKGIMEHEKSKQASGAGMPGMGSTGSSGLSFSVDTPKIAPSVSMPGSVGAMAAPTISGGFDVSV